MLETFRHFGDPNFISAILRRTSTKIRNVGGLWTESTKIYENTGAIPRESRLEWTLPGGGTVKFGHLEYEKDLHDWHGSQIVYLAFDELTTFTEKMFWYMMSRVRSVSGTPGYVRATCNPDSDSWVRKLLDWWIGPEGFPIQERSGILRYFVRDADVIHWADTAEELKAKFPDSMPKSFTFIWGKLTDNRILMDMDPTYLANLKALSYVDRSRLLDGNWNIRATAGNFFRREWFPVIDAIPTGWTQAVRTWDRAATKPSPANLDPDWTRGLKMLKYPNGKFLVADLKSCRDTPYYVEQLIKNTASQDSTYVRIVSQQDPGSAGVAEAEYFVRMLCGYDVHTVILSRSKVSRAKPVSAQAEAGNIVLLRGDWNEDFFRECESFSDDPSQYLHDDIVDVLSLAFGQLTDGISIADVL